MGAATLGFFVLSSTKAKGVIKLGNKAQQSTKQKSLVFEAIKNRQENIQKGVPESVLGLSGKPKMHEVEHSTRKRWCYK